MRQSEFIEIVKPFEKSWFRFVLIKTQDLNFAKDCIQDLMELLWEKRYSLSDIKNLNNYGFIIIRNKTFKFLKNQKKHLKIVNDIQEEQNNDDFYYDGFRSKLVELVNTLSERQRDIFILKDLEGLTYQEVEEITGLNNQNIRTNLSLARTKIRDLLKKQMKNEK